MTFNPFRTPSPAALAVAELDEAQRQLLAARSALEYASAMSSYHEARIARLRAFLAAQDPGENHDVENSVG